MLFRSVSSRMRRSSPSQSASLGDLSTRMDVPKFSTEDLPGLLFSLSNLLRPRQEEYAEAPTIGNLESQATERVFPALELISQTNWPTDKRPVIRELVLAQTGSKVWAVRDIAARTYASLVDFAETTKTMGTLINETVILDQNSLHGRLLCMKYMLQKVWTLAGTFQKG